MNDDDISMDTIVPKTEAAQDGHVSMSSSVSTPEPEEHNQDVTQTQKRKGGRKPVCCRAHAYLPFFCSNTSSRFMPHQKSANSGTGRLKLLFAKDELSTSNS
jgi:hypothetical protein